MNNTFDYETFERSLSQATNTLIDKLIVKYGEENLRAFCLYSDEDAGSAVFSFDTHENYQKRISECDPSEIGYYKWYFGEWLGDDTLSDELNQISKTLFSAEYGGTPEDFEQHRDSIYDIFVSVLADLRNGDKLKNDLLLMFGVSDFNDKEFELYWVAKLNSEEVFNEFKIYREMY